MSKQGSAYGTPAGDTEFRKTRNVEEYAARAKQREAAEREEAKARYEAKLAGKRYYKPLTGAESLTSARAATLDLSAHVGRTQIVPAGAGVGRRGRGAGFYCPACDWTVKDNLQWVEHINSVVHLRNVGQTGEVARSTADEVLARIEAVWARVQAEKQEETINLAERLALRQQEDERERERRRTKKRELAERKRAAKEAEAAAAAAAQRNYGEDVRIEGEHDEDDMMAMMGITGFGSTKKG
ncbi:c2h2 finger domain containing protein [Niveomyces insectorum RCEF 264]|uniref:C2h2 finger domain containing protein n=1 Tax=Niveomyces insectorum RCEF 264 TaxID=1081102 RepID=A0A162L066_9HYPO|nr:c2h2 finger domain containing protein [Niveomyces insectorum RCEF 264]